MPATHMRMLGAHVRLGQGRIGVPGAHLHMLGALIPAHMGMSGAHLHAHVRNAQVAYMRVPGRMCVDARGADAYPR